MKNTKNIMKNCFISKTDLAVAYFPFINQNAARNKLMHFIATDAELMHQLEQVGYTRLCRQFSPKQVEMIMAKLGNPFR